MVSAQTQAQEWNNNTPIIYHKEITIVWFIYVLDMLSQACQSKFLNNIFYIIVHVVLLVYKVIHIN